MTILASEVERFDRLSRTWWQQQGPMRPLHVVNQLRLDWLVPRIAAHVGRAPGTGLAGLRILDLGCGGGLLSEPLARRGAQVVGIDASAGNVEAARRHAAASAVVVDYRHGEAATQLRPEERFDVVLALEVVEHVADVPTFLRSAANSLAPGGLLVVSTINRSWKSFVFAIVGAEYLLRLLPRGTHRWGQFVRPAELRQALAGSNLVQRDLLGMRYQPWTHRAAWTGDTQVNYLASFSAAP